MIIMIMIMRLRLPFGPGLDCTDCLSDSPWEPELRRQPEGRLSGPTASPRLGPAAAATVDGRFPARAFKFGSTGTILPLAIKVVKAAKQSIK